MPLGNLPTDDENEKKPIIIVQQQQPLPKQMPIQPIQSQEPQLLKPSFGKRLVQGAKTRILNFHYGMLERKRQNALLKQQNPKKYAKLVAERNEKFNIMKGPNLFDGSQGGRIKW